MATLKDISQATGVSIRTVSRVLKKDGYVSSDVRDRVLAAVKALDYVPNRLARSLRTRQSYEVCVLTWSVDELQMAKIVALEHVLREQGYAVNLLMDTATSTLSAENATINELLRRAPAGVITLPACTERDRPALGRLLEAGIPCVSIDPRHQAGDRVLIDRQTGVYEAVMYLGQQHAGAIAYVGISSDANDWARLEGYRQAVNALGRTSFEIYPDAANGQFAAGVIAASTLAERRPAAVQAFSDVVAMGVLHGLNQLGVQVPTDIAVVGFDNRGCAAYASPPLTTIAQPNEEAGQAAAELLLTRINDSDTPEQIRTVSPKLTRRQST